MTKEGPQNTPTSSSAPSTLILGGGFTLSRVAQSLPKGSFVVTARSEQSVSALKRNFPVVHELDLGEESALHSLLTKYPGLKAVIDGTPPPDDFSTPQIFTAARSRALAFKQHNIKRVIYISTTGVYGTEDGSWVTAETPANPKYKRGKRRLAVEDGYRDILGDDLTVLRVPAIYGPGRGLGSSLKSGRYRLIDGGTRWSNRIEVSDLAAAIVKILSLPSSPKVLCISDGSPAQACDVVDFYCTTFNLPRPASISEEEAFAAGLETMLSNQRINSTATWALLGIEPKLKSFREGAKVEMAGERS